MAKDKIAKAFLAITKDKFTIDTIAEMIATKHLAVGDIVQLNGYYTAGDGAGHKRKIEATDDGSGVQLANGLWANIISEIKDNKEWFSPIGVKDLNSGVFGKFDMNYQWVIDTYYEPLRLKYPEYITRKVLGKDDTNTYDIYEYTFEPKGYTKKIMLISGVHGTERQAFHSLGRFINMVYSESVSENLMDIRYNTKIVLIPCVNPYGVTHNTYRNGNNIDINRDYDYRLSYGTQAFRANETRIVRDFMKEHKSTSLFMMDWHTVAGHTGYGDIYTVYNENSPAVATVWKVAKYFGDKFKKTEGKDPVYQVEVNEFPNSVSYGWRCENLITIIPETNELSWGSDWYDLKHCYKAIEYYSNLTIHLLKDIKKPMSIFDNNEYLLESAFGGNYNYQWNGTEICKNIYDKLVTDGLLTSEVLGKDQSGTFNIKRYIFSKPNTKRTVYLNSGIGGAGIKGAIVLAQFIDKLLRDYNSNEKLRYIRATTKIIIDPTVNIWGMNQGAGYGSGKNRVINNSRGVNINTNFNTFSEVESLYIKKLLDEEVIDYIVSVDSFENGLVSEQPYVLRKPSQSYELDSTSTVRKLVSKYNNSYSFNKIQEENTFDRWAYKRYGVPSSKIILNDTPFSKSRTFERIEMSRSFEYLTEIIYDSLIGEEIKCLKQIPIEPVAISTGLEYTIPNIIPFSARKIIVVIDFGHPNGRAGLCYLDIDRDLLIPTIERPVTVSSVFVSGGTTQIDYANIIIKDTGNKLFFSNVSDIDNVAKIIEVYYK